MTSNQSEKDSPPGASTAAADDDVTRQEGTSSEHEAMDFVAKEMAEAFKDIARGEEAATLIEANLTALERKLDDILAAYDGVDIDAALKRHADAGADKPSDGSVDGKAVE